MDTIPSPHRDEHRSLNGPLLWALGFSRRGFLSHLRFPRQQTSFVVAVNVLPKAFTMRNAVKDYNTYADVDEDFYLQGNHRHVQVPRRRLVKVARFEDLLFDFNGVGIRMFPPKVTTYWQLFLAGRRGIQHGFKAADRKVFFRTGSGCSRLSASRCLISAALTQRPAVPHRRRALETGRPALPS